MKYRPIHPELFDPGLDWLRAPARKAIESGDPVAIRALAEEIHEGLFVARLVTPEWCRMLTEEIDAYDGWCRAHDDPPKPPNSMHRHGVVLAELGLDPAMQWLTETALSPLARELYAELAPDGLVAQHAFIADYGEGRDVDLALHVDQSDVTLDLCLGETFTGGALVFEGRRCFGHLDDPPREEELFDYAHVPGQAVIHAGKNRHRARPVTAGRRVQLVIWGRKSADPEQPDPAVCPEWCGARRR